MAGKDELPDTLRRSPAKAQRTWIKAHDAAVEQYGEGERAHRTAFAAVKQGYEKVGDRWVAKKEKGPSDPGAAQPGRKGETYGGVDAFGNTRQELYERARKLGVKGRSKMTKADLAKAIARRQ